MVEAMVAQERTYPAGVPCWIELEHPDVDAARHFYGELFGWTFDGATALLDGAAVAGVSPGAAGMWTTFIAVRDADVTVRAAARAGGAVLSPGACADPQGADFALWPSERPGAQVVNLPGAWNFSNLHTPDPGAASRFYGELFGWEADDVGGGMMMWRRPGYGDHLAATVDPDIYVRQASAPKGFADAVAGFVVDDRPPAWRVVFSVADRDAAAVQAADLGAEVLATEQTMWTRTASIRDPQGAELTLSQFTPPDGF